MSNLEIETISMSDLELEPQKFWEKIYLNNLTPIPSCSTCQKIIDDPSQWVSFTCGCPRYYHKKCIHDTFESLVCPNCQTCKHIYAFPKFLCKFMDAEQYYQVYDRASAGKDRTTRLNLYRVWFHTYSIYTPPFLDLYEYLEPHDPFATISFLETKKDNHRIECYDPAFTTEENAVVYDTSKINYFGKKVFVELDAFRNRLEEYSYGLIGNDFPYQPHMVLAGGAVHKCLESRIDLDKVPKYSNLDIFICHPDAKILMRDTKRAIKYFQDLHGENIFWVRKNSNIVRLFVPGFNRSVQLVLFRNHLEDIISKFDFSHTQFVYNGKQILTTLSGIEYANYLVSLHHGYYDIHFPKRFIKAKALKLCMALPLADSMTINLPKELKISGWYPTYTDDLEIFQQQMKNVFGIKSQYVTKSKPCRILYTKIPTEFHQDRFCSGNSMSNDDEIMSYIEQETIYSTYS